MTARTATSPRRLLASAAALAVAACASAGRGAPAAPLASSVAAPAGPPAPAPAPSGDAPREFGVDVLGVRSVAANHILDFRFRVVDAAKAAPLLSRRNAASLVDEESGRTLGVPVSPKIGPLRTTTARPEVGRTYFVLFRNPGGAIPVGRRVKVMIGEFQTTDLVVE